jgi:hypothetical protein
MVRLGIYWIKGRSIVLIAADLTQLVRDQLWKGWRTERVRLDTIDDWYRWTHDRVPLSRDATLQRRALEELSRPRGSAWSSRRSRSACTSMATALRSTTPRSGR